MNATAIFLIASIMLYATSCLKAITNTGVGEALVI